MPSTPHTVLAVRRLPRHAFALRFTREGLGFRAGQHVSLSLGGDSEERDYSLYSGEDDPFLEVLVREVEGGELSPLLGGLEPGDDLWVSRPTGVFVLDPRRDPGQPLLLVATGTGIAPFHSFLRTHPGLGATVVHGVRYPEEAYDRGDYPPDQHVLCCTRGEGDFRGRVTDWLREHPPGPATQVFLCGNADMTDEAMDSLLERGHPLHLLSTEIYF